MGFDLIRLFSKKGMRVFTLEEAKRVGEELGIASHEMVRRLFRLKQKGLVEGLMKGLYSLAPEYLSGVPLHEYEIAAALAQPCCIAYLSAYSYHKLTDQLSSIVYLMTPLEEGKTYSKSLYRIRGVRYRVIRIHPDQFFGCEKVWIGDSQVQVTDLERTLIDGLVKPKYCGGFREVLDAYSQSVERINMKKIISYAQRTNDSVCKRLGYILSSLNVDPSIIQPLRARTSSSYSLLDASGPQRGPWNKAWLLRENL